MACHILHPVFKGLNLGYPSKVEASSTMLLTDSAPNAEMVKFTFPARDNLPKVGMPEVEVYWYDGGLQPMRPAGVPANKNLNESTDRNDWEMIGSDMKKLQSLIDSLEKMMDENVINY